MSGSFIAKNISVGKVNLGEWSIKQNDQENLLFNHNDITQMSLAKGNDIVQNQTSEPEVNVTGTLKLNEPINVTKSDAIANDVTLNILFNEAAFQSKADAFGFKLAYCDVADTECEVFYKDYSFGKASQNKSVFLTKETLKNPLFFRFSYSKIPSAVACMVYPSQQSSEAGGGLLESVPFGIKFREPVAPKSRMMDFTSIPTTSSTAGGTVSENDTFLHGLVVVNEQNIVDSDYASSSGSKFAPSTNAGTIGSETIVATNDYRFITEQKRVEQTPVETTEFLCKLVDKNGLLDINNISVRFYQFSKTELLGLYSDDIDLAHTDYGNRIYQTTSQGFNYNSLSQVPKVDSHKEFTSNNSNFNQTTYDFNNILVYKLSKNGHDAGIVAPNENHATNLYVRFKLILDKSLYSNDIDCIVPFIYINGSNSPVALGKVGVTNPDLSVLDFGNLNDTSNVYGTYNYPGYGVSHVTSGKPTISVYKGSYELNGTSQDSFRDYSLDYDYFRDSWTWNEDNVKLSESLDSEYLVIENTSKFNSSYVSIAFNGTSFEGSISSSFDPNRINISDNIRFTSYLIRDEVTEGESDGTIDESTFATGNKTLYNIDNNTLANQQYLTSTDSDGSYVVHIPPQTLCVVKYTLLQLPDYIPADMYSQMFTVTDITDYNTKPTEAPIYRFKYGTSRYEFHSDFDEAGFYRNVGSEISISNAHTASVTEFTNQTNQIRFKYTDGTNIETFI